MKIFMLVISCFSCFIYKKYIDKIIVLEDKIFILYSDSFKEYLIFDDDYKLSLDKEKLKKEFILNGYSLTFYNDLCFKAGFDYLIDYKKEYCFYMVINDEY